LGSLLPRQIESRREFLNPIFLADADSVRIGKQRLKRVCRTPFGLLLSVLVIV
jgi:hypothetical protein